MAKNIKVVPSLGIIQLSGSNANTSISVTDDGQLQFGESSNTGSLNVTGDLVVQGSVTAQEFKTEFVSASIIYRSGSTKFGDTADDIHSFTGSLSILSGSATINATNTNVLSVNNSANSTAGIVSTNQYLSLNPANYIVLQKTALSYEGIWTSNNKAHRYRETDGTWVDILNLSGTDNVLKFGTIGDVSTGGDIAFYTSGSEKVRITDDGNLAINATSTSGYKLYVNGSTWINGSTNYFDGQTILRTASGATEVMRVASNGNVGIGTTSPTEKLHVVGNIKIEDLNPTIKLLDTNGADWDIQLEDNHLRFKVGSTEYVRFQNGGNVGIGTTSPATKLDVDGTGRITDTVYLSTNANSKTGIGTTSPGTRLDVADSEPIIRLTDTRNLNVGDWDDVSLGRIQFYTSDTTSPGARALAEIQAYSGPGAASGPEAELRFKTSDISDSSAVDRMVIDAQGRVGIGTTSPTQALTVAGNILQTSNSNFIATRKIIGRDSNGLNLTDDSGANGISIKDGGNVQFTDYGSGNNTGTPAYRLSVDSSGNIIEESIGAGAVDGLGSGGYITRWEDTDTITSSSIYENNGDIGIGTVNPSRKLHVYLDNNDEVARFQSAQSNDVYVEFVNNNSDGASILGTVNNNFVFSPSGSETVRFTDEGRVGIGTTNPQLGGTSGVDIYDTSYPQLRLHNSNTGTSVTDGFLIGLTATTVEVRNYENTPIDISTNSQTRMRITGDGKVGIGTTSPSDKLHVVGDVMFGNESNQKGVMTLRGDNPTGNTEIYAIELERENYNPGVANAKISFFRGGASQDAEIAFFTQESNAAGLQERLRITDAGKVGIGTTSPSTKLHISGSTGADSGIRQSRAGVKIWDQQIDSSGRLIWSHYASEGGTANQLLTLDDNNNVGIGTSSPGSKLTVTGNIEASGSALKATNAAADSVGLSLVSPVGGVNVTFDFEVGDTGISNLHSKNLVIRSTSGTSDIAFSPSTSYPGLMMLDGSTGRVGIGTTSPGYKLEVNGTARFSGETRVAYDNPVMKLVDANTTIRYAAFQITTNGGTWTLSSGDSNTGTGTNASDLWITRATDGSDNRFRFYRDSYAFGVYSGSAAGVVLNADGSSYFNGGNVGIGTTSPGSELEVNGSIEAVGNNAALHLKDSNDDSTKVIFDNLNGNSRVRYYGGNFSFLDEGSTETLTIADSTGNVGIGTTSPTRKLDVESSQAVIADFTGTAATSQSFVDIENVPSGDNLRLGIFSGGKPGITTGGGTTPTITIDPDNNNNVGIGTTAPSQKLEVRDGNLIVSSSNSEIALGPASGKSRIFTNSTRDIRFSTADTGDVLFLKNSNGRVGIGTTNPSRALHVVTTGWDGILSESSTTNGAIIRIKNTQREFELSSRSDSFHIRDITDSDTNRFTINSSGSVGIGTTSPSKKLTVIGDALISGTVTGNSNFTVGNDLFINGDKLYFTNDSAAAYIQSADTLVLDADYDSDDNPGGKPILFRVSGDTKMTIDGRDGNVGIGTTNVSARLHLSGSTGSSILRMQSPSANTLAFNHYSGYSTLRDITLSNNRLLFLDSGAITTPYNIGIGLSGATAPAVPLHVSGTFRHDGSQYNIQLIGGSEIRGSNAVTLRGLNSYAAILAAGSILHTAGTDHIFRDTNSNALVTIKQAGNVGIGVTNPGDFNSVATNLVVGTGAGSNGITVYSGTSSAGGIYFADESGSGAGNRDGVINYNHSSATMDFKTGGNQRLLSLNTGTSTFNLGDVVMENNLTVKGIVTAQEFHTEFVSASIIYQSGSTKFGDTADDIHSFTGSLEVSASIKMTATGHSYTYPLEITSDSIKLPSDSTSARSILRQAGAGTGAFLSLRDGSGDEKVMIRSYGSAGVQAFFTAGNVGIGTTSPSEKLEVNGNIKASGYLETAAPVTPTSVNTSIVNDTIELTFVSSSTADIDNYLVFSSVAGGDYGLLSVLSPEDFSNTMSVIDNTFSATGTIAYRVYAVKSGVYSTAGTSSISYSIATLEPTQLSVVPLNTAYYVQWDIPSTNARFVSSYNVYMDAQAVQGDLNRSNATLLYSGLKTNYMYNISGGDNDKYHQFWVEITTL